MNIIPYYDCETDAYYAHAWIRITSVEDGNLKYRCFYPVTKEVYNKIEAGDEETICPLREQAEHDFLIERAEFDRRRHSEKEAA